MKIILPRKLFFLLSGFAVLKGLAVTGREHSLVRALQKKDRHAFDSLMKLHAPGLTRFVSRRVKSPDRDDVLQDTWLAVWESSASFDGSSQFRTWLFAICYHKIQDYWRREQCRPPSKSIVDAEGVTAHLPAEFGTIELRESLRTVWEACTPDQRELLRMYYADGLNLKEISIVLKRNLNTVKYQFYRAHATAAEHVKSLETDPVTGDAVTI
ncbi:MAG TPA: RNA polymerase sigma factor [Fimbriimonas sp.]|nr:RNA polymerase sigma factor [Fimbriimonas sp.]